MVGFFQPDVLYTLTYAIEYTSLSFDDLEFRFIIFNAEKERISQLGDRTEANKVEKFHNSEEDFFS